MLKRVFGFWILLDILLGEAFSNLFIPDSVSDHAHTHTPQIIDQLLVVWVHRDSPCRTAASAAEDPVEAKRCRSESDLCPPAAVRLLVSRPVRRSQQLPALVRIRDGRSVLLAAPLLCSGLCFTHPALQFLG